MIPGIVAGQDLEDEVAVVISSDGSVDDGGGTIDDTFPLDGLGPTGAYSTTRPLLSTYAGALADFTSAATTTTVYDQSGTGSLGSKDMTAASGFGPAEAIAGPNSRIAMDFNGVDDGLLDGAGATLADYINTTEWYVICSAQFDSLKANHGSGPEFSPVIVGADGVSGLFGLHVDVDGVYAVNYDNSGAADPDATTAIPVSVDTPYVVEGRLSGGILYCRLNGGTEQQIASGALYTLVDSLRFGRNSSGVAFLDGKIFEVGIFSTVPSLTIRNLLVTNFRNWIGA